jgi:hypothetical protein
LGDVFKKFQPVRVTERLGHFSQACKDRLLRSGG